MDFGGRAEGGSRLGIDVAWACSRVDGGGGARGDGSCSEAQLIGLVSGCCNRLAPLLSPSCGLAAGNRDQGLVNSGFSCCRCVSMTACQSTISMSPGVFSTCKA